MSSPLSLLKKTRRAPLPGVPEHSYKQRVSFKGTLSPEFTETPVPKDSSEHERPLTPHASANLSSTSKSRPPHKKGSAPTDFELVSAMTRKVIVLKKIVKNQAQEIESKDKKISALETKLRIQTQSESEIGTDEVHRRCQQLQNQVSEMENFLNDYGLIWVGHTEEGDSSEQTLNADPDPCDQDGTFSMNFDLVLQRIRELNILVGEGESFIQKTVKGAQLAQKEPIQLSLYSNGIVMFDGPFRSYQECCTQQCMTDLMDGYFPSELQDRFPDGSPFETHDRRNEEFIPKTLCEQFPGQGRAVRGEKIPSSSTVSYQLFGDQFLDKLPKMVVKSGRVIKIREPIREMMQGVSDVQSSSDSAVLIETPALQEVTERPVTTFGSHQPSSRDVITLKVRSEDGDQTFIVKMHLSETVGHLRKYVDQHRRKGSSCYDIISAHPQRHYDDANTLQSYGLTTNTTLLLQKKQQLSHSLKSTQV